MAEQLEALTDGQFSPRAKLGAWLQSQRRTRGLSQTDLALRLGCGHYSFVATVEAGRRPLPFVYVEPLAEALGLSARDVALRLLYAYEPNLGRMLGEPETT